MPYLYINRRRYLRRMFIARPTSLIIIKIIELIFYLNSDLFKMLISIIENFSYQSYHAESA